MESTVKGVQCGNYRDRMGAALVKYASRAGATHGGGAVFQRQDDLIRIRIDTNRAVSEFLNLLATQAAEGETCAPANPANRAIFRELAPFRLVEYAYVDNAIGGIEGAYLGFVDGSLFAVSEDIPEPVVDALLGRDDGDLPPVYLYLVLAQPQPPQVVGRFLTLLAAHLGRPLVGVCRDEAGRMAGGVYGSGEGGILADDLSREVSRCVLEANRHLDKARVLRRLAERNLAADGRAFARITYRYTQHVAEFANSAARDDFIAWSRTMCEWIYARWCTWEELGLTEILRPAEVTGEPDGDGTAIRLVAPSEYEGGTPWQAFGGKDAASALHFTQSDAAVDDRALRGSLELAQRYWRYVTDTIAAGEALIRTLADDRRRRGMKLD